MVALLQVSTSNNAAASNPIDIVALDKHIRKTPLYQPSEV
jgi:hypothetical protein